MQNQERFPLANNPETTSKRTKVTNVLGRVAALALATGMAFTAADQSGSERYASPVAPDDRETSQYEPGDRFDSTDNEFDNTVETVSADEALEGMQSSAFDFADGALDKLEQSGYLVASAQAQSGEGVPYDTFTVTNAVGEQGAQSPATLTAELDTERMTLSVYGTNRSGRSALGQQANTEFQLTPGNVLFQNDSDAPLTVRDFKAALNDTGNALPRELTMFDSETSTKLSGVAIFGENPYEDVRPGFAIESEDGSSEEIVDIADPRMAPQRELAADDAFSRKVRSAILDNAY